MISVARKSKNLLTRRTSQFLKIFLLIFLVVPSISRAAMDLQRLDGSVVNLDQHLGGGKWLLVMLWATDCHICKQQKPEMSRFHDRHKDTDASVLGIALDGIGAVEEVKNYLEQHQPSFPNYVGDIAIIASNYLFLTDENLRGTPTYLLFNPAGELVGNNPGPLSTDAIEKFIAKKSTG